MNRTDGTANLANPRKSRRLITDYGSLITDHAIHGGRAEALRYDEP